MRRKIKNEETVTASSKNLRKVKMFYGNCFEEITDSYFVPACLNNIRNGRPYDEFNQMNLTKYLTINKASRGNSFKNNPAYNSLLDEFDSVIRNASHHGAIKVAQHNVNYIEYRSGDAGGWKKMSYATYLFKCNAIFINFTKVIFIHISIKLNNINS